MDSELDKIYRNNMILVILLIALIFSTVGMLIVFGSEENKTLPAIRTCSLVDQLMPDYYNDSLTNKLKCGAF